ncbi:calmodulin, striated muscle-like [Oculina patagonica]
MISEVDSSGNGRVEFAEYKNHIIRLNTISDRVWKAFDSFDLNGDDYITSYELQRALKRMEGKHYSMKEVRGFIAEADLNNDEKINPIEFDEMIKKHS